MGGGGGDIATCLPLMNSLARYVAIVANITEPTVKVLGQRTKNPFIAMIVHTVNVDIFALYIFSRNSPFLNIRENMYTFYNSLKSQLCLKR